MSSPAERPISLIKGSGSRTTRPSSNLNIRMACSINPAALTISSRRADRQWRSILGYAPAPIRLVRCRDVRLESRGVGRFGVEHGERVNSGRGSLGNPTDDFGGFGGWRDVTF